jgi:sialic acid synthase SpsE
MQNKKNLKVGLSLFNLNDFNYFKNYKFDFFKIPSPVCHDYELINFLKKKTKLLLFLLGAKIFLKLKKLLMIVN